jgi:hypothetical protein
MPRGEGCRVWSPRRWTPTGRDTCCGGLERVAGEARRLGAAVARGGVRNVEGTRAWTHSRRQDNTHQKISATHT